MKVLVAVKRVVDPNVRIRVRADGTAVDTTDLKTSINPFDEVAVEQAVRLKEARLASEIVLVSIGPSAAKDTLRAGLAMGADRGILVEAPQDLEPLAIAKLLEEVVKQESPALVLLGKQSIDADAAQCGPMLAAMLGWGQATFAVGLQCEGNALQVTTTTEDGSELIALELPAVVTADLRLADPRFVTLPLVMSARRKPIATFAADTLVPPQALTARLQLVSVAAADQKRQVAIMADAAQLVDCLRTQAKVLEPAP